MHKNFVYLSFYQEQLLKLKKKKETMNFYVGVDMVPTRKKKKKYLNKIAPKVLKTYCIFIRWCIYCDMLTKPNIYVHSFMLTNKKQQLLLNQGFCDEHFIRVEAPAI